MNPKQVGLYVYILIYKHIYIFRKRRTVYIVDIRPGKIFIVLQLARLVGTMKVTAQSYCHGGQGGQNGKVQSWIKR